MPYRFIPSWHPKTKMQRKPKPRNTPPPSSSHPEAEDGVAIFNRATRSASRCNQPVPRRELRKPIVSIDGRDVEKKPGRAA
jgi:hypothetical protein